MVDKKKKGSSIVSAFFEDIAQLETDITTKDKQEEKDSMLLQQESTVIEESTERKEGSLQPEIEQQQDVVQEITNDIEQGYIKTIKTIETLGISRKVDPKVVVNFRLKKSLKQKINALSRKYNVPQSVILENIIEFFFNVYDRKFGNRV